MNGRLELIIKPLKFDPTVWKTWPRLLTNQEICSNYSMSGSGVDWPFFENVGLFFKDISRDFEAFLMCFEAILKIVILFEDIFREIEAF
jgi:hypothetical protein